MSDKMREEFEAWINKQGYFWMVNKESYWEAWKASRAALCVELPSKIDDQSDKWSIGYDCGIDDALDALILAGVRYK